jgi:Adenylate and Guanylate cyclase catalytic domain
LQTSSAPPHSLNARTQKVLSECLPRPSKKWRMRWNSIPGTFPEVQGDGLLAIFGAPQAIEDHPVHACRAALAIQGTLRSRRIGGAKADGITLDARIGINSGVVVVTVVGEGANATCHAVGIPVHLASRIQTQTPPGQIGLSRNVYDRIAHLFEANLLGEFELKGISTAQEIYVLRGPKQADSSKPALTSPALPLVGRSRELQVLMEVFSALGAGKGAAVCSMHFGDPR